MNLPTPDTARPTARRAASRSRLRRLAALGAAAVATLTLLSACTKPRASITVFSGSTARSVAGQPACVITGKCVANTGKVVDLDAAPGSTILIDVPTDLAHAGWVAAAYASDQSGANSPIAGAGTSAPTTKLSARVAVPQASGGYYLQVSAVRPSNQLTTWIVRVAIKN